MVELYPYVHGDALQERRRYNYAPYVGRPLLAAWQAARAQTAGSTGPAPAETAWPLPTSAQPDDALDQLAQAWRAGAGVAQWQQLRRLIQHFEVGQRIYGAYAPGFVPRDRTDYRHLNRYLLAAELFESACTQDLALDALNALLKMLDLLSTQAAGLDAAQAMRLGELVRRESTHVQRLARARGVSC